MSRHVYQSSVGGKQPVPLESDSGLILGSTPRFAQMLSWKYAHLPSRQVSEDLSLNHFRTISSSYIQKISYGVGDVLLSIEAETVHSLPITPLGVERLSVGRDGAMMRIRGGGFREAMVGTLSAVDKDRNVLHTIYVGDSPEIGKAGFDLLLENEITDFKKALPNLKMAGVADGSEGNWRFLADKVDEQIIDWWHAMQYIKPALAVVYADPNQYKKWVSTWEERLMTKENSATKLVSLFRKYQRKLDKQKNISDTLKSAITYLSRHKHQMNYVQYIKDGYLIGSGVTESACKTMIKGRFCGCGMQWTIPNSQVLILIRGLVLTKGRWENVWAKLTKVDI